jgi:hypothetical protein
MGIILLELFFSKDTITLSENYLLSTTKIATNLASIIVLIHSMFLVMFGTIGMLIFFISPLGK